MSDKLEWLPQKCLVHERKQIASMYRIINLSNHYHAYHMYNILICNSFICQRLNGTPDTCLM